MAAKLAANMAALETLRTIQGEGRTEATVAEQQILGRWASWGAIPQIFVPTRTEYSAERERLQSLLTPTEYEAARRTTINAHYTDAAIVSQMWQTVQDLGFTDGAVLEPGSGVGTFIGMAPATATMTGVELDPTTAAISQLLYPQATVRAESFADTKLPNSGFDAVIGNVPFGDISLHDPAHNANRHSIHNHFIIKSVNLVRPGGLVAVITSSFTMDAKNPAARREMSESADLVTAVRLPNGAHQRAAGTSALTDILIFRKREPGTPPRDATWVDTVTATADSQTYTTNQYWMNNPEHMLGTVNIGTGMYGSNTVSVKGDITTLPQRLQSTLDAVVESARSDELMMNAVPPRDAVRVAFVPAETHLRDGHITRTETGFTIVDGGEHVPLSVPRTRHAEVAHLLELRTLTRDLLETEASTGEDTREIAQKRAALNATYDAYHAEYGPINRFTYSRTGKVDPETGMDIMRAVKPPAVQLVSKKDPFGMLVPALELFDPETQIARKAGLLNNRQVITRTPIDAVGTPAEALAVTLDQRGIIDLETVADLLSIDHSQARGALGDLVYDIPSAADPQASGGLATRAEYLSGDVREKLETAQIAAEVNPAFQRNVDDLRSVIPTDLGPADIQVSLGAVWIDAQTHQEFAADVFRSPHAVVESDGAGTWVVKARTSISVSEEWGTSRVKPQAILQACLEQKPIEVREKGADDKYRTNVVETAAAQEKAAALQDKFRDWVFADPFRARALCAEYNRRFNAIVLRDYTQEGQNLTLPGLAAFTPRPHQRTAVARMIAEPSVGLFHQVGAGKTAEMVMGVMELKRLGMVNKPLVVIPNHMLEQFAREWLQLYPRAAILAASSRDLTGDDRRALISRVATNDWDAVILTQGAYKSISLSPEVEKEYLEREIAAKRAVLEAIIAAGGDAALVKRMEKELIRAEERLKAELDIQRDPGLNFEALGVDYLVVDEAHMYKNLSTQTAIPGISLSASAQARDMHMKIEYLRSKHGKRVVTMATATPIANSVAEMYIMTQYLRPDLLRNSGINNFDQWAATFGEPVTALQVSTTGQFTMKTHFAKFKNVPELLRMFSTFADVKTAKDLNLPTPALRERSDGLRAPEAIAIDPTPELKNFIAQLADRAEAVASGAVQPTEDNMLTITNHGRYASLDMRLIDPNIEVTGETKLSRSADILAEVYHENKDNEYLDGAGEVSPRRGALQIVFCDLGTPKRAAWNVYDQLKDDLVERGVPRDMIRFVQDATNDEKKAALFEACRSGEVAVIIGSTQMMGVGTNIQSRAVHLMDLEAPWRPADIAQRHGRIERQGNQNREIRITQPVVKGSFDTYMWQTLERKARFIDQVMSGNTESREIEDIGGSDVLSMAEVKAISTGNPLLLEQASARAEVTRLANLEKAHRNQASMNRLTVRDAKANLQHLEFVVPKVTAAVSKLVDTSGDKFVATINGVSTDKRVDASTELQAWARSIEPRFQMSREEKHPQVIHLGGHHLDAQLKFRVMGEQPVVSFTVKDLPSHEIKLTLEELTSGTTGVIQRLENHVQRLEAVERNVNIDLDRYRTTLEESESLVNSPFKYADQLTKAREHLTDVDTRMQAWVDAHQSKPEPDAHSEQDAPAPPVPETEQQGGLQVHSAKQLREHLHGIRSVSTQSATSFKDRNRGFGAPSGGRGL